MEKRKNISEDVHMLDFSLLSEEARKSFYPTPDALAKEMVTIAFENLPKEKRFSSDYTILEPSAGDGRLIRMVGKMCNRINCSIYDYQEDKLAAPREPQVDYIEIDKNLRAVVKDSFSKERYYELRNKQDAYREKYDTKNRRYFYEEGHEEKYKAYGAEMDIISHLGDVRCVGDDFLSFRTFKKYDLIIMNPPYDNGDQHLLKAISMQKKTGGSIICLLNAETIRNPYSMSRKELIKQLSEYGAEIKYIEGAFESAERGTDVEVALIYMDIEAPAKYSFIFEDLQKAREEKVKAEKKNFVTTKKESFIENMIEQYEFEIELTKKLVAEYEAIKPFIPCVIEMPGEELYAKPAPIVRLTVDGHDFSINKYLKIVRQKYWKALFHNPQFTGALTSNMRDEFYNMVSSMDEYDFNEFNISQIKERMAMMLEESYYDTILSLFDKLSCVHSYSGQPEETNVHYYTGWKTNKAWKINKKVIIPCYGCFDKYSFRTGFDSYEAYKLLGDIERVLNYIDNGRTEEPMLSLSDILESQNRKDAVRNLDTKYFRVTFYKKGTCHIVWKDPQIIEKLNIFGSQKKGWLPPGYGTKAYKDMTDEEKSVIDDFQGQEAYEKVMAEKDYYLVNSQMLQLPA